MKATEFDELVRKMRTAQRYYRKLHPLLDMEKKLVALHDAQRLERQVDAAEITNPSNLVREENGII